METENKRGQLKFRKKAQKERRKNAFTSVLLSMIIPAIIIAVSFLCCFFFVNSEPVMYGKLQGKEHYLVNRMTYLLKEPTPGDVVCYRKDGIFKIGRILFTPQSGKIQEFTGGNLYFSDPDTGLIKTVDFADKYLDNDSLFGSVTQTGYLILPDDRSSTPLISDNDIYDKTVICGKIVFAWGNIMPAPETIPEQADKTSFLFENKTKDGVTSSTGEYISAVNDLSFINQQYGQNPETCSLHGIKIKSDTPVNTPVLIQKEDGSDFLTTELSSFVMNKDDGTSDIIFELPRGYQGKYRITFGIKKKTYIVLETEEKKNEN